MIFKIKDIPESYRVLPDRLDMMAYEEANLVGTLDIMVYSDIWIDVF